MNKYAIIVPTSHEIQVDNLWYTTRDLSAGERAAEYLRYGEPVYSGRWDRNPYRVAEDLDGTAWLWDFGWPYWLPMEDEEEAWS